MSNFKEGDYVTLKKAKNETEKRYKKEIFKLNKFFEEVKTWSLYSYSNKSTFRDAGWYYSGLNFGENRLVKLKLAKLLYAEKI